MTGPKLAKLELQIMETLWTRGSASIREIQEAFPEKGRPAYTTIQTTVYRLEGKKAVRRVRESVGESSGLTGVMGVGVQGLTEAPWLSLETPAATSGWRAGSSRRWPTPWSAR